MGIEPWGVAFDAGTRQVFVTNVESNNVSIISDTTDTVVAAVSVGYFPSAAAYDPAQGEVFVANDGSASVSVISDSTDSVVATVPVGLSPYGEAYDAGRGQVFVTNLGSNNVSVISGANDSVVATIPVGSDPAGVAYDPGKGELFVANLNSSTVSVISDSTDSVVATIPVGLSPLGVAYDPADNEVFVTLVALDSVTIVSASANAVVGQVAVGSEPLGLTYETAFGRVYVADINSTNLTVIQPSTRSVIGTVAAGDDPAFVAYDNATRQLFVTDSGGDNVSVVNDTPATVEVQLWDDSWFGSPSCANGESPPIPTAAPDDTEFWLGVTSSGNTWFPYGSDPFTAAFSATLFAPTSGVYGFQLSTYNGAAAFLDASPLANTPGGYCGGPGEENASVTLSAGAHQLRVFYTSLGDDEEVSFLDLLWEPPGTTNFTMIPPSALGNASGLPISVGTAPGTPVYADGKLFVPDTGSAALTVVSGATQEVLATIPVGDEPGTPVYDNATQEVFVPSFGTSNVSVVNASSVGLVAIVPVGNGPQTGVYDAVTGDVYVPNAASGNVTVLSGVTDTVVANVTVGLDPQTPALDTANGEIYVANNGSNTVSVVNASDDAVVATVPVGSEPGTPVFDPANGEVYVPNWGSDNVSVISGATNTVVATIAVGGSPFGPRGLATLPFGFSRTTRPRGGPLYDFLNRQIYVANAGSDNLSVISGAHNQVIASVPVGTGPEAPVLDPANGNIYVANNGSANLSVISGNTSQVVASIPTGANPAPPVFDNASGTLFVPDAGSSNLTVVTGSYYLTFTETGLPSGANWRVAVIGGRGLTQDVFSRTTSPAIALSNGTVLYTIFGPSGYQVSGGATGSVTIAGADVVVRVTFVRAATRSVAFVESGLPKGVTWCATFGFLACTKASKLTFANLTPSHYTYALLGIPGFTLTVGKGGSQYAPPPEAVVNVTTHNVNVKVQFKEVTYALSFTETGLPTGKGWSVKVTWTYYGKVKKATGRSSHPTITVEVPNGTVTYTVVAPKGYAASTSGTVTVDGASVSVPVTFTKV